MSGVGWGTKALPQMVATLQLPGGWNESEGPVLLCSNATSGTHTEKAQ